MENNTQTQARGGASSRTAPIPAPALKGAVDLGGGARATYGFGPGDEILVDVCDAPDADAPSRLETIGYEGPRPSKAAVEVAVKEILSGGRSEVELDNSGAPAPASTRPSPLLKKLLGAFRGALGT